MTTRTLIGLGAALAVLVLLALYGQRSSSPDVGNDGLLLPELASSLDDIDRVTVVGAGGEALATLERRDTHWAVAEKDGYPADVAKLRAALVGLAEARIVEQKTSNPDYYDRLGVEPVESEAAAGVAITASRADATFPTVVVGDAAGSGYRYVRRAEDAVSYMVDGELDIPRDASEWVDPAIVDVRGPRVREVTIVHPDGETVRISKADPDQTNFTVEGVPDGRELLYPGVANVIGNALRELRLEDVESAGGAGEQEVVRATFRTFDGLVVTIGGVEREDAAWIEVEASADAAGSAEAAGATGAADGAGAAPQGETSLAADAPEARADGAQEAGATDAPDAADEPDPEAEAARINERVSGWRYRIPSYQFDQMTRRMSDLSKAAEEPAE